MKYALLIFEPEADESSADYAALIQAHMKLSGELRASGVQIGGAGLQGPASAVTLKDGRGGRVVHDGPFAESKEHIGGFYLIDVSDRAAAVEIARRIPLVPGGAVEVRPLLGGD